MPPSTSAARALSLKKAAVNPRLCRRPSDTTGRAAQSLMGSLLPSLGPGARKVLYGMLLINSSTYGEGVVKLNAACKTLKTVMDTRKDQSRLAVLFTYIGYKFSCCNKGHDKNDFTKREL